MDKRDEQAITAIRLYFERGLSQAEVAAAMGLSRPTVAKLLQRGKEAGYVTVVINDPRETSSELGRRLQERYGLVEVRVVHAPVSSDAELLGELGRVGAELVTGLVRDGMSVGVSWGRTMSAIAARLQHTVRRDVRIVQLKGGSSYSEQATDDFEVMRAFCDAFNAVPLYLPLPVVFQDVTTWQIVQQDPHIAAVLAAGAQTDAVVFTVGAVTPDSLLLSHRQLDEEDRQSVLQEAVGDACSRFFNDAGQVAVKDLNERTVGITLEDLASRPVRVLVAGGQGKARAVSTALTMGLSNHLVVDQRLALTLLDEGRPEAAP